MITARKTASSKEEIEDKTERQIKKRGGKRSKEDQLGGRLEECTAKTVEGVT